MPPRYAYWTIIFGNQPTAFRTHTQEELLPTFRQIQSKHPDAVMMWFAHGRLWKSPEEAREARYARRHRPAAPKPRSGEGWRDRPAAPKPRSGEGGKDRPPRDARAPRPHAKDRWRNRPATGNRPPVTGNRPPDSGSRPPDSSGRAPDSSGRKPPPANRERPRGRDWRPGGEHKDPRDRFKVPRDVKRARFKAQAWRDRTSPKPKRQGREGGPPKRKKEDEE